MKKIAFYLNNQSLQRIDYSKIISNNPGLPGSEYEILFISYLLDKRDNNFSIYLMSNNTGNFPHENVLFAKDLEECCNSCLKNGISTIVIDLKSFNKSILDKYNGKISVVIWAHNTISYHLLNVFYNLPYIKKIINVGREQMELYRDQLATLKSTYIYNTIPIKSKDFYKSKTIKSNNHNVVYMGSIIPVKGFHILAKAWKKILYRIPDAQLYVIGNGQLYDRSVILGKYGIAEQTYEDKFIKYLTDSNGKILPSVHFMGLMGEEKFDIIGKCKVGVPNPTGITETFCICGIEMQLTGCNIVTIKHPAFLDTIIDKSFLYRKTSSLAKNTIQALLKDKINDNEYNKRYSIINDNFGIEKNIIKWEYELENISTIHLYPISKYNYQNKKLKNIILKLKIKYPFLQKIIPPIELIYIYIKRYI